jgi:hypothetical protein
MNPSTRAPTLAERQAREAAGRDDDELTVDVLVEAAFIAAGAALVLAGWAWWRWQQAQLRALFGEAAPW